MDLWPLIRHGRRLVVGIRLDESWTPTLISLGGLTREQAECGSDDHRLAGGMCYVVSEVMHVEYGLEFTSGCYHGDDGSGHVAHVWNILPDGRFLDLTADQFGDVAGWRIVSPGDPRYDLECPLDGTTG